LIKIGITGQKGFVGTHLYNTLKLSPNEFSYVDYNISFFKNDSQLDSFVSQCDVIFQMEAGNRCFDQRVPEETNRKIVGHISYINLTYSNILEKLEIEKQNYFVVSAHREENISSDRNFNNLLDALNKIAEVYQCPIIFSTHPRTRNRLNTLETKINPLIRFLKLLGFHDYNHLQKNAKALLSDSGTISEESSIMNFPALNIREAHERPEAMEEASIMMIGLTKERILQGLKVLEAQKTGQNRNFRIVSDYSIPNVADKVVRISYTDYINQNVWKK
jgi:UDP-N-acetylglucosamine 2-epimerase (non-hydrolysing)